MSTLGIPGVGQFSCRHHSAFHSHSDFNNFKSYGRLAFASNSTPTNMKDLESSSAWNSLTSMLSSKSEEENQLQDGGLCQEEAVLKMGSSAMNKAEIEGWRVGNIAELSQQSCELRKLLREMNIEAFNTDIKLSYIKLSSHDPLNIFKPRSSITSNISRFPFMEQTMHKPGQLIWSFPGNLDTNELIRQPHSQQQYSADEESSRSREQGVGPEVPSVPESSPPEFPFHKESDTDRPSEFPQPPSEIPGPNVPDFPQYFPEFPPGNNPEIPSRSPPVEVPSWTPGNPGEPLEYPCS